MVKASIDDDYMQKKSQTKQVYLLFFSFTTILFPKITLLEMQNKLTTNNILIYSYIRRYNHQLYHRLPLKISK